MVCDLNCILYRGGEEAQYTERCERNAIYGDAEMRSAMNCQEVFPSMYLLQKCDIKVVNIFGFCCQIVDAMTMQ